MTNWVIHPEWSAQRYTLSLWQLQEAISPKITSGKRLPAIPAWTPFSFSHLKSMLSEKTNDLFNWYCHKIQRIHWLDIDWIITFPTWGSETCINHWGYMGCRCCKLLNDSRHTAIASIWCDSHIYSNAIFATPIWWQEWQKKCRVIIFSTTAVCWQQRNRVKSSPRWKGTFVSSLFRMYGTTFVLEKMNVSNISEKYSLDNEKYNPLVKQSMEM